MLTQLGKTYAKQILLNHKCFSKVAFMKVMSKNRREAWHPRKKYTLWQSLSTREWDILWVDERKWHDKVRYIHTFCGHSSLYARQLSHHYSKCSSNDGA